MMTNSAIPMARTAASQLLGLNAIDGNIGIWLAATTSFGEILDLDQFPAVPGSGPARTRSPLSLACRLNRVSTSTQTPTSAPCEA